MNIQKLLHLLSEFNKNSFKEKRLVFGEAPSARPEEEAAAREREKVEKEAAEARQKLGEEIAALLIKTEPLTEDETTKILTNLDSQNEENLKKIAELIKSDRLSLEKMTPGMISKFLGLLKKDEALLQEFFASSIETIQNLIIAAKDEIDLLNQTFDYLKKTTLRYVDNPLVIQILIEKLGRDIVVAELTTKQKSDILNDSENRFSTELKIELFNNFLKDFTKLNDYTINSMANFSIAVAKEWPGYLNMITDKILTGDKLNSLTNNTLVKFVETLALQEEKTQESYAKIIKKLETDDEKKKLFTNTEIKKIKTDLGISETPAAEAVPAAPAAAVEAPTETTIDLTKVSEPKDILKEAGLLDKGRSVAWNLKINGGTDSERSFIRTAKFKKQFQAFIDEQKKSGNSLNANRVKLFCYEYLWREIYKSGKIENKYKLVNFEQSQEALQAEIKGLKAKFEPTAAPAAVIPGASEAPAAPIVVKPSAAEPPAPVASPDESPAPAPTEGATAPTPPAEAAAAPAAPAAPEAAAQAPVAPEPAPDTAPPAQAAAAEAPATAPALEAAPEESELDRLKRIFFENFDKVEETTRTITPGDYQLKKQTLIYQENATRDTNVPNLYFDYLKITDPKIYKLTKDTGKDSEEIIYVVKSDEFSYLGINESGDAAILKSPSIYGAAGFINITDIVQGHNMKYVENPTEPSIESDWTKPPELTNDPDLIKDKIYEIKSGTNYYTINHIYHPVPAGISATVIDEQVREVEDEKYAKVKISIEGTEIEAWIAKNRLIIPEEDTIWISNETPVSDKKEIPDTMKVQGTYEITKRMRGSELLADIFTQPQFKEIKTKLEESGLSNSQYLRLLLEYRQGNTLSIIVPEKQLSAIMAEYERTAVNPDYETKESEGNERIDKNRDHYFKHKFYLQDQELIEAINDDELWNDLWEHRGKYKNKFIDGLEKITVILKQFGIKDEEIRDDVRELLQIGINEKITFEEIFDRYIKDKIYEEISNNNLDFIFGMEIPALEKALAPWQTGEGKAKRAKIDKFYESSKKAAIVMRNAVKQGHEYQDTPEWKSYKQQDKETKIIRAEYLHSNPDATEGVDRLNIPQKEARLQFLKKEILFPIAKLLDAFESLNIGVSVEQTFDDQNEELFAHLTRTTEIPMAGTDYYSIESLVKGEDNPQKSAEAPKDAKLVSISQRAQDKFTTVLMDLSLKPENFSSTDTLKLIFQLYTLDTLSKENCLQKNTETNKFLLIDLPRNFNKDNEKVKELFTKISSGDKIKDHKDLIRKISEAIDQNKATIRRVLEVFSKDEGPLTYDLIPIDLLCISYIGRLLDGEDRRELTLTMSDIGAKKDTLLPADYMQRYNSDKAAFSEILSLISHTKDGIEYYDAENLKKELTRRAMTGLYYLDLDKQNFPKLRAELTKKYGDLNDPKNYAKAQKDIAEKIEDQNTPLDDTIKNLIRIGHVIDGIIEKNQKEIKYSENPKIKQIQEELVKNGYIKDEKDLKKVEEVTADALIIPVYGSYGINIIGPKDMGDGWTITPGIGITDKGVNAGVGASKGIELTKDGRTVLTFSVQGTVLSIGGGVSIQFPIGETTNMNLGAGAGVTYIGFYALGFVGAKKDLNAEALEAFRKELEGQGFKEVERLQRANATPAEIKEALLKIPGYGDKFKKASTEYQIDDNGLLEIYGKLREEMDAKATEETKLALFEIIGGGVFAGTVNVIPVGGAYVELAVGDKIMIVRSVVPGQENMDKISDEQVETLVSEQLGKKVEVLKSRAGDSGHFVFDAETGNVAVLEGKQTLNLKAFDTFKKMDTELDKANMGISRDGDSIRLHIGTPKEAPGNIKVIPDPLLKEQGISFTVQENKILFKGVSEQEMRKLIITREDFHYPFNKEGVNKFSIITIKSNPKRSRTQIEQESPNIIYQTKNHRPEIRAGIGHGKSEPIILEHTEYEKVTLQPGETVERKNMEDFEQWRSENRKALRVLERSSFESQPRKGIIPDFANRFIKKHPKLYKQLSTLQGKDTEILEKLKTLNNKIKEEAEKAGFKNLTHMELNMIHLHLMHKSFMSAREKEKIFKRNLEICKNHVLKPFFETTRTKLGLTSTGEAMANKVAQDILERTDIKSDQFEKFAAGTLFLSAAGTMDIIGLRGSTYYGGDDLDIAHGILAFKQYNPEATSIDGEIGKVILEILSPLEKDSTKVKEFMKSPLALKLASMDAMYLILGPENAKKVTKCFETKEVTEENREAFEKFRNIVLEIRKRENLGINYLDLENGYQIKIDTRVGMGSYKRCTNPTMAGTENLEIFGPAESGGTVAYSKEKILLNYEAVKKAIPLIIGIYAELPKEEKAPIPKEEPEPEQPKATPGHKAEVAVGPVGATKPGGAPPAPTAVANPAKTSGNVGLD